MKVLGVIPARYGSTRLPAKPLLKIHGRPLLEWVIRGVHESETLNEVVVATDHLEIAQLVENLGVRAVMTPPELPSGSDRVWAVAQKEKVDIVVNIQGDEPLIAPYWVDQLVSGIKKRDDWQMATIAHQLPVDELDNKGTVKLIMNKKDEAIYFSRWPIPYSRETIEQWPGTALKHIGLYAYRKDFLKEFCSQKPTAIEKSESLEQLRALWLGAKIGVIPVECTSIGVDTSDDVLKVENILRQRTEK